MAKQIINNITEDRCSFEVSKLLKEKGFDVPNCKYWNYPHFTTNSIELGMFKNEHIDSVKAPTHALAIKWIRENFDISIDVASYYNPQKLDKRMFEVGISHKDNAFEGLMQNASNRISIDWTTNPNKYWIFDSPEEATEAALLYCLKI